ncbi:uroporphyrinogen decarboxylase [Occultella glacieicola]|uniref:Uroporphyrinogen decarboxylase n=1 Tax=Occultella glacieicola TaxID=2518684 RepID=A0ABY2E5I6_9MICO|nr:uroporphyrinogen decarboxylase [Occultella glacieicola]TDE95843.1 uroporphyrinogen decarboxylase [Occultella glacieicola]
MSLLPADHPLTGATASSPLVRAYSGERPPVTPVWFMRQAGRSLPEYRALRTGTRMLQACLEPDLVTEISLQPVRRHGVDAAIFFSDIVVPLRLIGVDVDIVPGKGPVLANPVRTAADVAALRALTPDGVPGGLFEPVTTAVGQLVRELGGTPLIGFAGAPFTLAAYLVEGGPSKDQLAARTLMHGAPEVWADLMSWLAELTGAFLLAQVRAGASAAQLFDSWAGGLSLADYRARVAPQSAAALAPVRELQVAGAASNDGRVPTVHFGVGTGHLLGAMHEVGVDVVGVDYRTPLDTAAAALPGVPLQGNVDPALLAAPWPVLEAHVQDVLARGTSAPAHVLNLGHGVPPETDPTVLTRIVETVHAASGR